jgi:hypothetical protein
MRLYRDAADAERRDACLAGRSSGDLMIVHRANPELCVRLVVVSVVEIVIGFFLISIHN